jgi:O-antigen ligase
VKWVFLAIMLAAILPVAGWLRRNPRETPKIWMLMGFLPFGLGEFHLYMAAISWPQWPGYVKGLEISVLDVLALAMYLSIPRAGKALPFRLSMALYFLAVVLAVFQSAVPIAALFYAWQIARMFLVYAVVAKACEDERVAPALLTGMIIGLSFEACFAIWERFGLGLLQVGGTMGHQNFLGLMSHFVTFPWLALLLAGERGWRPVAGPLVGLIIAALTVSRGVVGLLGAGYVGIFVLSMLRRWTSRKAIILAVGVASGCVLAPVILSSFEQRFNEAERSPGYDAAYDERAAFESAATSMISDHPFGVGANYYVVAANTGGYNTRADVTWAGGSESANVHNIYFLVAAETGYIGLITFVLMLLQPLIVAFRCGWRNRGDRRGDLLLGLGMSLLIVYVHSYFEWIFISFQAQYMFALNAGMVAGLATQLGYWRSPASNRVALDRARAPLTRAPGTKAARN